MMRLTVLTAACAIGLLSAAGAAHATQAQGDLQAVSDTSFAPPAYQIPFPHKSYAFDSKRWGFRLEMNEPTNRATEWKDVTAGAYFRIAPNLKLGGSVGLGDKFAQPQQIAPQDTGPRVHLETKFQF